MIIAGSVTTFSLSYDALLTSHCIAVVAGGLGQHIATLALTPERIVIFIKVGQTIVAIVVCSQKIVLFCHGLRLDNVGHSCQSVHFGPVHLHLPNPMVHQDLLCIHITPVNVWRRNDIGYSPYLSATKFQLGSDCEGHLRR